MLEPSDDGPGLDVLLDEGWAMLERGAGDAKSAFHTPVLGSIGSDGRAQQRTVVLRAADRAQRVLICHTDVRCPKVAEIRADARVGWLFYDPARRVQVRVSAQARVHHGDALADARWEASALSSRRCYLAPHAPGAELAAFDPNLPRDVLEAVPSSEVLEPGRSNFAAVVSVVETLEYLHLASRGHRRARFDYAGDAVRAAWVAA